MAFRKVHVGLGPNWVPHQQLFYTLRAMGKSPEPGRPRVPRHPRRTPAAVEAASRWPSSCRSNGVDRKQFTDTFESFAVRTNMRKAQQQAEAYRVDGVPAMAVNGKWYTSPSMAGGNAQVLRALDHLIELERKGGK